LIFSLQNFLKPFNSKNSLQKHQDWNYKYIHNGLQHFPLTSPTLSSIPENILNEFNVLETDFVVNKKYFIDNFYANPNSKNRYWFFYKKKCNEKKKYKNIFMISLHHINTNLILWLVWNVLRVWKSYCKSICKTCMHWVWASSFWETLKSLTITRQ
jgi:hypothetical protein